MDEMIVKTVLLVICMIPFGCTQDYGQAELYEGDQCSVGNGIVGFCKNIERCESIKVGIKSGFLKFDQIVTCSFIGFKQIACCLDQIPVPSTPPPTTKPPDTKSVVACKLYRRVAPLGKRIIGGTIARLGEFPWMAALGFGSDEISFDCGGTIISEYFILTAAHCTPSRRRPVKVRLGKVSLLTDKDGEIPVDINIQEIIMHPEYKASTKKNDIALLRLAERIIFTNNIRPACMQTDLKDDPPNTELLITGWGTTSADRTVRPEILLKTDVTSMPLSVCNSTLLDYNLQIDQPSLRSGISESQCCAFDPQARNDACQGDSGGPLQMFHPEACTIVGVVSFGISCGTSLPGVYTRVAYYIDWIESIVWPNSYPVLSDDNKNCDEDCAF